MKLMGPRPDSPECVHVWELLSSLGEQDPGQEALAEIARHFEECVKCHEAEASLEAVLSVYRAGEGPPLPDHLQERLTEFLCRDARAEA